VGKDSFECRETEADLVARAVGGRRARCALRAGDGQVAWVVARAKGL